MSEDSQPQPQRRQRRPQRRPAVIEGLLIRGLARLLALLPLPVAHAIGDLASWLSFPFARSSRAVMEANLRTAFPQASDVQHKRWVRESYRAGLRLAVETGLLWHGSPARWDSMIETDHNRQAFEALLAKAGTAAQPHGTLLLVPHFGNWELLSLLLGRYDLTALYDPPRLMSLETTIRRARERAGATLLPIDRRGIRGILTALNNGGAVAILPDQVPDPSGGLYVPFFGRPTLTMTLAQRLIQKARPEVVLLGIERHRHRFRLHYEALNREALIEATPEDCLRSINAATERLIAVAPPQYQWAYKRYKRPPPGIEKLY